MCGLFDGVAPATCSGRTSDSVKSHQRLAVVAPATRRCRTCDFVDLRLRLLRVASASGVIRCRHMNLGHFEFPFVCGNPPAKCLGRVRDNRCKSGRNADISCRGQGKEKNVRALETGPGRGGRKLSEGDLAAFDYVTLMSPCCCATGVSLGIEQRCNGSVFRISRLSLWF